MSPFVAWPMVIAQAKLDAFGPISRRGAETLLKPGCILLRRSPHIQTPKEWYLTGMTDEKEIQNFRITRICTGDYMFAGRGHECTKFETMDKLISSCTENRAHYPFDITKRITPFSIWSTGLQIVRSSIAPMLKYDHS